ncbi:MAG: 30S ribosomal protein S20 [Planctomycetota bacterium JB042]
MPHSNQAKKRLRQDEKRRLLNKAVVSRMKTQVKRTTAVLAEGDAAAARESLRLAMKRIDKAAKKNVIHKNTAARKKSLLARRLRDLEKAGS